MQMRPCKKRILTRVSLIIMLALSPMALIASKETASTKDTPPDLNGIWQAVSSAHWNIERHVAAHPPLSILGALGATPPGMGVVDGNKIPYQAWADVKRKEHFKKRLQLDPAVKCYMPGIPRATYMPFPFQIVQTPKHIFVGYQFAGASRTIYMDRPDMQAPVDTWMGLSKGHWENGSLTVEVINQVADTWFDRSGNFHSEALKVTERFTPQGPNHLLYEATIADENVFTKPWTIRLPLYRRIEKDFQLLDFRCIEFAEKLMYEHLGQNSEKEDK